jgi:hypothetical protein
MTAHTLLPHQPRECPPAKTEMSNMEPDKDGFRFIGRPGGKMNPLKFEARTPDCSDRNLSSWGYRRAACRLVPEPFLPAFP